MSRSTGVKYYFHKGLEKSVWCDDRLPAGWGFVRKNEAAPKEFYNLFTHEQQTVVPTRGAEEAAAEAPPVSKRAKVAGGGAAAPSAVYPFLPGRGREYIPSADVERARSSGQLQALAASLAARIVSGEIPFPYRAGYTEPSAIDAAFAELQGYQGGSRVQAWFTQPVRIHAFFPRGAPIGHRVDGPIALDPGGSGCVLSQPPHELLMPTAGPPDGTLDPASPLLFVAGLAPAVVPWDATPGVSETFSVLIDFFTERARMAAVRKDEGAPPTELWCREAYAKEIAGKALAKHHSATDFSLRLGMYGKVAGCNLFKPHFAKTVYEVLRGERVLDMCAGWGCRLMGALGSQVVKRYLGFDPNPALVEGHAGMIARFGERAGGAYSVVPLPFEDAVAPVGGGGGCAAGHPRRGRGQGL